ncbi:hypothetical protein BCR35DRAFT_47139 [Leucosporidium creatinivorum]|uniref:Uncharacterized protein n=1 Tax=Leucosporidium creatinivorum TaxID=106004 RepID=A0A1Y2BYB5_9BASI|nr:hypothetical protein BCR35DRAFT_47139 [Leucosporidium creatinivorum]
MSYSVKFRATSKRWLLAWYASAEKGEDDRSRVSELECERWVSCASAPLVENSSSSPRIDHRRIALLSVPKSIHTRSPSRFSFLAVRISFQPHSLPPHLQLLSLPPHLQLLTLLLFPHSPASPTTTSSPPPPPRPPNSPPSALPPSSPSPPPRLTRAANPRTAPPPTRSSWKDQPASPPPALCPRARTSAARRRGWIAS